MKATIYEKYLECYISNDQECFEDGAGYGCGINEEKCQALKGYYYEGYRTVSSGRYMFIGAGHGYLNGYVDDNPSQKLYFIDNIKEDFFLL